VLKRGEDGINLLLDCVVWDPTTDEKVTRIRRITDPIHPIIIFLFIFFPYIINERSSF
jgi:hypothetical protein